jgi:hypothetical protein
MSERFYPPPPGCPHCGALAGLNQHGACNVCGKGAVTEQYSDAVELAETLARVALEGKRNERELRECIRQAAKLLSKSGHVVRDTPEFIDAVAGWLALPAVQSALALEAADRGER